MKRAVFVPGMTVPEVVAISFACDGITVAGSMSSFMAKAASSGLS
jgi:hypothetical protein